ncbi:lamin tail domain-containing protein [Bacteroidia bacterium]|nr:lamin tail domain-containing protein [Bacteroidia bacterium]MDB9881901.1 lamin tail domain-containing protein [Bacteroidia bacterium]MDC1394908.1 lamin tail domain-containing protein [Bacteroidia bacterium]
MRPYLIVLTLFILSISKAQVSDDFSDGNFTANPDWGGDADKFTLDNGELRSNSNMVSDVFYLSTQSTLAKGDLEWRFRINLKLSTSGANYTDVYLMADNENLEKVLNGYFIRVGNTKDEISLYKVLGGTQTQLTNGTDGKTHNKDIIVKVTKGSFGSWAVSADYTAGTTFENEGTATDNDITTSSHFGFLIKQSTSSFHLKHFFDDIYVGPQIVEKKKPSINSANAFNDSVIVLTADELVNTFGTSFLLNNGYGSPSSVQVDGSTITLTYATKFLNNSYELNITMLSDLKGNLLDTLLKFDYFKASTPSKGDILISEIFADPTPSVGLPELEYIELYNASSRFMSLENLTFSDGGNPAVFPKINIAPGAYLIVKKLVEETQYASFGDAIGLSGFPALNNSGDRLSIRSPEGEIIDSVSYTTKYYHDEIKRQGGYSLELTDFTSFCGEIDNWTASTDATGGTPGKQNSVLGLNPDQEAPEILSVVISAKNEIKITLDENLYPSLVVNMDNFMLEGDASNPVSILENKVEHTLTLSFIDDFEANRKYSLLINNLSDCKGNGKTLVTKEIVSTERAVTGDILINELLFNPKNDGVDFVELYNNSEKYIDLKDHSMARFVIERKDEKQISDVTFIVYPHQFTLLTTDSTSTKSDYASTKNLFQVSSLPSLSNDAGTVLLLDEFGIALDSVPYSEDQHFELLNDVDGVSLERISFKGKSYNPTNWHSASSSVGFATPGYQNSQFIDLSISTSSFTLESKTISPDGDGHQDVLSLTYSTDSQGHVLNGYVFDLSGRLVYQAFNNETLGNNGVLNWDGIKENGIKTAIGNYILLLETFNLDGKVTKKKLAFSIVGVF